MRNDSDPLARLLHVANLIRQALDVADEQEEYMVAAKLDETLVCVQQRIDRHRRDTGRRDDPSVPG